MKIITFNDVRNAGINPATQYEWVSEALALKDKALLPAKISLKPTEGVFYNAMPVLIPVSLERGGCKIVTRYPERSPSVQAQILLYDLKSGECLALMDGDWITTMRTGAVAAHSIKLFAVENFSELAFIGLGNTARATLSVLLDLFPNRRFHIKLKKYKEQHLLFAERFANNPNLSFTFCETYDETVADADVVTSAVTYFDLDICSDKRFKEGVCLVPVHTRGFTNCDLFFDKIFADDVGHVKSFKNFDKFKSFAEVAEVVAGKKLGRENDKERILAYNIGIALHDVYFASKIYDARSSTCQEISLESPTEKFWA